MAYFEIVGPISGVEIIAIGRSIRQISRLREECGHGRWRKLKNQEILRLKCDHATRDSRFCIQNRGAEDLKIHKLYRVLMDKHAAASQHLRVVDDSGEDYLYPAKYFVLVELPAEVQRALRTKRTAPTHRNSAASVRRPAVNSRNR